MLEKIKKNRYIILSFIIIYIGMYVICRYNMFAQDEYNYSHIAWTSQKLTSFNDIITSLKLIYTTWSGRMLVLGAVQFFLFIGKNVYDLLNPLVFILFIILVIKNSNNDIDIKNIFFVLLFSLFGAYKFWQKYIWMSGSLNYLWPVTMMLLVLYYLYNIILRDKKITKIQTLLLFVFSFLAGYSHENVAFVLGSIIIFLCMFNIKKIIHYDVKRKVVIIVSVLLFGIGALLLLLCPGNFGRLNSEKTSISILPILKNIFALFKIIIPYVITVIMLKKSKKINEKYNAKDILKEELKYYILPILFALLPMVIISDFPIRAALAYESILFILLLKNINIIYNSFEKKKVLKNVTVSVVTLSLVMLYAKSLFSAIYLRQYKKEIEGQIQEQIALENKNIVISKFEHLPLAKVLGVYMDIFPNETSLSINNKYMSIYYGVDSIVALEKNYAQVEIDLKEENEVKDYNLIDKNTGEILASRITKINLPLPNKSINGMILFNIPIESLNDAHIDLPNNVKENISDIKIRSINTIDNFNSYSLIE